MHVFAFRHMPLVMFKVFTMSCTFSQLPFANAFWCSRCAWYMASVKRVFTCTTASCVRMIFRCPRYVGTFQQVGKDAWYDIQARRRLRSRQLHELHKIEDISKTSAWNEIVERRAVTKSQKRKLTLRGKWENAISGKQMHIVQRETSANFRHHPAFGNKCEDDRTKSEGTD